MKQTDGQFYREMWQTDEALRSCSSEAKGLFAQLIFVMHEAAPYSCLSLRDGRPLDAAQLSLLTGASPRKLCRLIEELENAGVLSRNSWAQFFSV